jgi:2-amino-4-hydroxy-6-hydroxymethyldihydropteridine diphosphokinase
MVQSEVLAYVSVGSNIEPQENILSALDLLMARETVTGTSTFYRTEPLGRPEQEWFANGIWQIWTDTSPRDLKFGVLRHIEERLGRVRTADRYAARTIDLDIALYGDRVITEADLVVPDPDILERPFLAVPLLELGPDTVLPGSEVPLAELPVATATDDMVPLAELTLLLRRRLMV